MNFFQLVIKQMRQRALSTWLTLLSVMLGVGLAIAIMIFQREGQKLFGQSDFGYDVIVGPKGSPTQLVLNTVYHLDQSPGNIPYVIYENLARPRHPQVRSAIPYVVGDDYKGFRVVGTSKELFLTDHEGKPHAREALAPNWERAKQEAGKWPEREKYIQGHLTESAEDPDHYAHPFYRQLMPFTNDPKELEAGADSVRGDYWRVFQHRRNQNLEFAEGRPFHPQKFEAVIGSTVAAETGLKVGSGIQVAHGGTSHEHGETWTVVGILKPTRTAVDKVVYIPLISFYAIDQHEKGLEEIYKFQQMRQAAMAGGVAKPAVQPPAAKEDDHDDHPEEKETGKNEEHDDHEKQESGGELLVEKEEHDHDDHDHAYHLNADGTIHLHVEPEKWIVSAILARTRGAHAATSMVWQLRQGPDAQAVLPAMVMYEFYESFLSKSTLMLLIISVLVTVVAAVSILVSIYNSVSARLKEIAVLRALGATRTRVLLLICLEAGLVGLLGGTLGLLLGHVIAAGLSVFLQQLLGEGIRWLSSDPREWLYLLVVVGLAVIAGLVPALKAYRTPVATHLVGV
jgi:putative ABC transport system permease protein